MPFEDLIPNRCNCEDSCRTELLRLEEAQSTNEDEGVNADTDNLLAKRKRREDLQIVMTLSCCAQVYEADIMIVGDDFLTSPMPMQCKAGLVLVGYPSKFAADYRDSFLRFGANHHRGSYILQLFCIVPYSVLSTFWYVVVGMRREELNYLIISTDALAISSVLSSSSAMTSNSYR